MIHLEMSEAQVVALQLAIIRARAEAPAEQRSDIDAALDTLTDALVLHQRPHLRPGALRNAITTT